MHQPRPTPLIVNAFALAVMSLAVSVAPHLTARGPLTQRRCRFRIVSSCPYLLPPSHLTPTPVVSGRCGLRVSRARELISRLPAEMASDTGRKPLNVPPAGAVRSSTVTKLRHRCAAPALGPTRDRQGAVVLATRRKWQ